MLLYWVVVLMDLYQNDTFIDFLIRTNFTRSPLFSIDNCFIQKSSIYFLLLPKPLLIFISFFVANYWWFNEQYHILWCNEFEFSLGAVSPILSDKILVVSCYSHDKNYGILEKRGLYNPLIPLLVFEYFAKKFISNDFTPTSIQLVFSRNAVKQM